MQNNGMQEKVHVDLAGKDVEQIAAQAREQNKEFPEEVVQCLETLARWCAKDDDNHLIVWLAQQHPTDTDALHSTMMVQAPTGLMFKVGNVLIQSAME